MQKFFVELDPYAMNTIVRIQAYKDFYANYDAEKDFQRMKVNSCLLIL